MTLAEAKRLLEVFRPGGADRDDPRFAEALELAKSDPELALWLEDQRRFDGVFAQCVQSAPVPEDLHGLILANRPPVIRPPLWRDWRVHAAMAAGIVALALAARLFAFPKPPAFAEFRKELIQEAWGSEAHLEFKSSDVAQIQRWLAGQGIVANCALPTGLGEPRVHGCQVVRANGLRVPMLCLTEGSKHLHLFIVEGVQFAGSPPQGSPDFERCGSWKTAAWSQGSRTYVLSGLKVHTFVSKFRRAGRWILSG